MANTQTHLESPLTTQSKQYNGIDLVKFLCALLVPFIHFRLFSGWVPAYMNHINLGFANYLSRIAVPFFFVCSGFFLFRKLPDDALNADAVKTYCFKLLRLSGIWYMLLIYGFVDHLWYLEATVVAVVAVSLLLRLRVKIGYIGILAGVLYLIGLLTDVYGAITEPIADLPVLRYLFKGYGIFFDTTRNGVFMGVPFVLMGAAFARRETRMKPLSALIGFAVSMLCMLAEVFLLTHNNLLRTMDDRCNMYVFLVPAVYFLFAFASKIELKDRPIYKRLREIGVLVYFIHVMIGALVYDWGCRLIKRFTGADVMRYAFFIMIALTLVFAILIQRLSDKKGFRWLKWLTS